MSFYAQIDDFHEQAMQATGLSDFGEHNYRAPMELMLNDLDKFPKFNALGIASLSQQITGLLIGRLYKQEGLKQHPDALKTPIKRPLFIVGMARTGTTVLHRILSEDPAIQTLPFWLGNLPMPRPPRETWESNPYFQQVKQALESSAFFNEETMAIHPMSADWADECRWSLDQTFWASTIAQTTKAPNYFSWFCRADACHAYQYHKQLLSLVANGDARRWVLKDPSHLFGIDSLLKIFPDACIVQTHREPIECMKSIANLGWATRRKYIELDVTENEHGQFTLDSWTIGLNKMENIRKEYPGQFYDVHINETRADPVGTIEQIYAYFGLPIKDEAHRSWQQKLSSDPNAGHNSRTHAPDFGLTRSKVNAALGAYYERYQKVADKAGLRWP